MSPLSAAHLQGRVLQASCSSAAVPDFAFLRGGGALFSHTARYLGGFTAAQAEETKLTLRTKEEAVKIPLK